MEKEIIFSLNTEPKYFIDWFYDRYFRSCLTEDTRERFPTKSTPYLYKPIGAFHEDDPISITMVGERLIDGKSYKGTVELNVVIISKLPSPRIQVRASFIEDEFFLPFFRMLAGIGQTYKEAEHLILKYVNKHLQEYIEINNRYHTPIRENDFTNVMRGIEITGRVENSTIINGDNNTVIISSNTSSSNK
jgi:hypothetical protein